MKTFKNQLKEEVSNWYIVKGTSSKGKVAHVGTERQLKLKIRKPPFPKGHILLKSRKDLKIGDAWKGSMGVSEEVKIDEGSVLDIKDVDSWMKEIEKGIDAPWIQVRKSALGGDENVAIMIKLSLDAEKNWPHRILHNSRYAMISLGANGKLEMFAKGRGLQNMRKTKFKNPLLLKKSTKLHKSTRQMSSLIPNGPTLMFCRLKRGLLSRICIYKLRIITISYTQKL